VEAALVQPFQQRCAHPGFGGTIVAFGRLFLSLTSNRVERVFNGFLAISAAHKADSAERVAAPPLNVFQKMSMQKP
jgi:hypothetical protein